MMRWCISSNKGLEHTRKDDTFVRRAGRERVNGGISLA